MSAAPKAIATVHLNHALRIVVVAGDEHVHCDTCGDFVPARALVTTVRAATPAEGSPDDLRALGWAVAVHNDYRLNGESHTFWLFTKGNRCVKGEGFTDAEALNQVRATLRQVPTSLTALLDDEQLIERKRTR